MGGWGGWGGGVKNVEKITPPFLGSKIRNLWVFFDFEPKKCSWGLYGAEWDERLCSSCTFRPFLVCWRFRRPR